MCIFPRKNYIAYFVSTDPPISMSSPNKSGGTTFSVFFKILQNSMCTKVMPVIDTFLFQNDFHLFKNNIDFCREKLQRLDRSVFEPLKKYVHREKTMTITENLTGCKSEKYSCRLHCFEKLSSEQDGEFLTHKKANAT